MKFDEVKKKLEKSPKTWLITGVAGFIGSNLLETLLELNQKVIGLDNFSTGSFSNLKQLKNKFTIDQWANFEFVEGDIRDLKTCQLVLKDVDYVLHQAALGSVPRSIADPITSNSSNVTGFLNLLQSAKDSDVKSFTYAASSSTYGDHPALPKVEENIGQPLSPYAVTKYVNELYASVYARTYGFKTIGLRYFNVFGPRQDPNGAYAAVIPKWTSSLISNSDININGDGDTSRDFCFVQNVVQANILAAVAEESSKDQVYNVALGDRTSLNELQKLIRDSLAKNGKLSSSRVNYAPFRRGDVRHSQADISKAKSFLGYDPEYRVKEGIDIAVAWYIDNES